MVFDPVGNILIVDLQESKAPSEQFGPKDEVGSLDGMRRPFAFSLGQQAATLCERISLGVWLRRHQMKPIGYPALMHSSGLPDNFGITQDW